MRVAWTRLQPSRQARRWRRAGFAIASVSSVALFAAAAASAPLNFVLALLGGVVAVMAWAAARERPGRSFEIGVSSAGEVELRECEPAGGAGAAAAPLSVSFASAWLISLRSGSILIPVWPDCLPHSIFRQLWVHLRWGRAVRSDDEQQPVRGRKGDSLAR